MAIWMLALAEHTAAVTESPAAMEVPPEAGAAKRPATPATCAHMGSARGGER